MVRVKLIAAMLLTLAASNGSAQEHQHVANGEKLGTVHFATSCNEIAQKEFNRAVALLHSFQFSRAIDGFNVVLGEDATCGIAYWGIALSDWSNPFAPGAKDKSQLQGGRVNAQGGKTVGAKTAGTGVYRGSRQVVQRLQEHATANAFDRLSRRHGGSRGEISRRP